mmetsp:Transcript_27398/g.45673  ORF Transcript_27398/g.45673 Transcript_27398/m.45673 type:complete len:154 (-) Transcript_27398:101-562(-)|eukprot:CAMPEP_0119328826 /NCGR_PEP_ID=MMETSP1333-20130426/74351_1 /TAXON_ID=418940 /ORGANISM="Scyphosphaera apsteinii, Strain RCC1455" /LENGTH=153 /DNA_ID=CAMNT_0007337807 /DNA_START=120 /DNA_END=581 /DNA_ORIENTATION=+
MPAWTAYQVASLFVFSNICCSLTNAEAVWTEHYDPKQNRKYYYNAALGKTQWELPEGETVQYMQSDTQGEARGKDSVSYLSIAALSLSPIVLVLSGLLFLYMQASKEGLADALKNLKARRDRSGKRKGTKAKSNYKTKFKLSQDGKGGRSANS